MASGRTPCQKQALRRRGGGEPAKLGFIFHHSSENVRFHDSTVAHRVPELGPLRSQCALEDDREGLRDEERPPAGLRGQTDRQVGSGKRDTRAHGYQKAAGRPKASRTHGRGLCWPIASVGDWQQGGSSLAGLSGGGRLRLRRVTEHTPGQCSLTRPGATSSRFCGGPHPNQATRTEY